MASLHIPAVLLGTDPEFFFANNNGVVIGSEKILPEKGEWIEGTNGQGKLVRDGVQGEINVPPTYCRESASNYLKLALLKAKNVAAKKGLKVSFVQALTVSDEEFDSLSDASKQFGCAPSRNAYNDAAVVGIDGSTYKFRAAGGHVHLGELPRSIYNPAFGYADKSLGKIVDYRVRLVMILDAILGNTCVLLDRDPLQVERRKYYGRAGEHRLPNHGLEYRTLSNFWIRHYVMSSFVFGMARQGVAFLAETLRTEGHDFEKDLLADLDFKLMIEAINTNDYDKAFKNWQVVRKVFTTLGSQYVVSRKGESGYYPTLHEKNIGKFDKFLAAVKENGLDKVLSVPKTGPIAGWEKTWPGAGTHGFEAWLEAEF